MFAIPTPPPHRPALPAAPDLAQVLRHRSELSPRHTRSLAAAVALLHVAAVGALLQVPAVRTALLEAAPVMVELLSAPTPPEPAPAPAPQTSPLQPAHRSATPMTAPAPVMAAPSKAPSPPEVFTTPAPAAGPAVLAVAATAAATAAAAAPAPQAMPQAPLRKRLAADAVGYLVPPPAELPLASRRAGESGVVWLLVVVDVRGLPARVQVQRSSGFPRLDAQAVTAMRQARFRPHHEDGVALEVEVTAPIEYPLE